MYSGLLLGLVAVAMGLDRYEREKAQELCRNYGYSLVEAKFGFEDYLLCLKMQPIGTTHLITKRTTLLLEPETDYYPSKKSDTGFPLGDVTMAHGFPVLAPKAGSAEGYFGEDHQFYGVLHLGDRTLHADPYGTDNPKRTFGAFESDYVVAPHRPRREHAQSMKAFNRAGKLPFIIGNLRRPSGTARAKICDLLLLADKEFFQNEANASLNHAVRRMMHAVAQADIIFRNADFNEDGMPDNIGFAVKYILVLTSEETSTRMFGDMLGTRVVDGRDYLMRFSRLRRLSEVCLGVAFSGHAFQNRTLGLSFTSLGGGLGGAAGGLCDRRAFGRSFNTLAIAHATGADSGRIPERIAALTLAHELGHSFGAHHDDNFPNPECSGYLMSSQSSNANSPMHFEFSLCSKRLIAATLSSMSYCLSEEDRPYCGNGIVEDGESCDCGLPSRCAERDPCCTPRAGGALQQSEGAFYKGGCEVAPSATCHPSQGPCCNPNCQHANLSKHGIDCRTLDQDCTCNNSECRCGFGGWCSSDGSCHAAECAALGLHECQCEPRGMGGRLSEANMCGVCCSVPGATSTRCLAAELAAREAIITERVPTTWLDYDYKGPNLTFYLCEDCEETMIRAWSIDEWCITMNMVGVCSMRGVCKPGRRTPRSNIYPDIMPVKLAGEHSASRQMRLSPLIIIYAVMFLVK